MPRPASIWWWEDRGVWCAKINGKRVNLGEDKKAAQDEFYRLKATPEELAATGTTWEVMDRFLDYFEKAAKARRTYEYYQQRLQQFKDGVPCMPARKLRPMHVQQWLDTKDSWSSGHKRGMITTLKRAFNWAARSGILSENPIANIEKPEAGQREMLLTAKQVETIIGMVKDEAFRDLLTVVAETGCRPQEATRVEARHFKGSAWEFRREESKGKRRVRMVFLNEKAKAISEKWASRHPEGPMFRNRRGAPWNAYSVSCRFSRLEKKLGYRPCLYLFRHAYAHHAITEARIDPVTVAALMGHSSTAMIYKIYGHLLQNEQFMLEAATRARSPATKARERKPARNEKGRSGQAAW